MSAFIFLAFFIFFFTVIKPLPVKELIRQQPLYQMRTQWSDLAKELNLDVNFETKKIYWFKTILKPNISGIKDGFHLNIALKKTGLLAKNTIECSIKIKNSSFLNFAILSKKKVASKTNLIVENKEFDSNFKISTNNHKELDRVLSPKIKTAILKLTNEQQGTKIKLSHKGSSSNNPTPILDSTEKSTLSFLVKEILFINYSDKNHIKDVVSLLMQIAKKIENLK